LNWIGECSLLTTVKYQEFTYEIYYNHKTCFKRMWNTSNCADLRENSDKFMGQVKKYQCSDHVVWVPVTTAWHVLRLQMDENPSDMEGSCEYIEQAATDS
jgi:hypothetical protein